MARTVITVQTIGVDRELADLTWTAASTSLGNYFLNDGKTLLLIKNSHSGAQTTTITNVGCSHGFVKNLANSTTNAKESVLGPFPTSEWNQSGGQVYVDATTDTLLYYAAISLA